MKRFLTILIFFLITCYHAGANVLIPYLLSDNMALQREAKITVCGWASEGETVHVWTAPVAKIAWAIRSYRQQAL